MAIALVVANLANAPGQRALHPLVVEQYRFFDHARTVAPGDNEYPHPFFNQVGKQWVLANLRPLRQAVASRYLRAEDPVLERSIMKFD